MISVSPSWPGNGRRGKRIVGTFCLYVPDEIIFAAGADRIVLCGGRADIIAPAEHMLPRNICPLIKSSFGAILDSWSGGLPPAPTCGWSMRWLPKRPATGRRCTSSSPRISPRTSSISPETRQFRSRCLLPRRAPEIREVHGRPDRQRDPARGSATRDCVGKRDTKTSPPALRPEKTGPATDPGIRRSPDHTETVLPLAPDRFRTGLRQLCSELDHASPAQTCRRIMIAGCPMAGAKPRLPISSSRRERRFWSKRAAREPGHSPPEKRVGGGIPCPILQERENLHFPGRIFLLVP